MPLPSTEMKQCIDLCHECHDACVQTAQNCLEKGGRYVDAASVRLLLDCAQICHTSEDFLLRDSDLHSLTCSVCAEVCARCADECLRLADDVLKHCAEVCRRCAASCQQMAGTWTLAGAGVR